MHPDSAAPLSSSPDPASPDPIASIISRLYDVRTWRAFDIDDDGRVLAGWDDLGSIQLVEIDTDGTRTPLTALPGACQGRYVPGRRQVIVQHDRGGDENMQLSVLDLSPPPAIPVGLDGLTPLVADPAYIHTLMDVTATSLVYNTNRRNGVDFDVVVRDLATGEETQGVRRRRLRHRDHDLARPALGGGHPADVAALLHSDHGDRPGRPGRRARGDLARRAWPSTATRPGPRTAGRSSCRPTTTGSTRASHGSISTVCPGPGWWRTRPTSSTSGSHRTHRRWWWGAMRTACSRLPCTRSTGNTAATYRCPRTEHPSWPGPPTRPGWR